MTINKFLRGLIKEMSEFIDGENPKNLRVFKFDKDGKQIEVINELELWR